MADFRLPRNRRKKHAEMPKVTESSCNLLSVNLNINCVKKTEISAVSQKKYQQSQGLYCAKYVADSIFRIQIHNHNNR